MLHKIRSVFGLFLIYALVSLLNIGAFSYISTHYNPTVFVEFTSAWSAFFVVMSALSAVELDSNRLHSATSESEYPTIHLSNQNRFSLPTLVILLVGAFIILSKREDLDFSITIIGVLGILTFLVSSILRGEFYAYRRITLIALILLLDALARFLTVVLYGKFANVESGASVAIMACAIGSYTIVLLLFMRPQLQIVRNYRKTYSNLLGSAAGSVLNALTIAGMPWIIRNFSTSEDKTVAIAIGVLTISRIPLVMSSSIQGFLVKRIVQHERVNARESLWRRPILFICIGTFGSLIALVPIVSLAYSYVYPSLGPLGFWSTSLMTLGSIILAVIGFVTLLATARGLHLTSPIAWAASLLGTVFSLVKLGATQTGIAVSLFIGGVIGLAACAVVYKIEYAWLGKRD